MSADDDLKSSIIGGYVRTSVAAGVTYLAGKGYLPGIDPTGFGNELTVAITFGIVALWSHMAKKAASANAIPAMAFLAFALFLSHGEARAADMPVPINKAAPFATGVCTVTSCSGFYLGGNIMGAATGVQPASGIDGNAFANGASFGAQAGYQLWNGQYFAAAEIWGDYSAPSGAVNSGSSKFLTGEFVKLGIGLNNSLFATNAPSASQGPTLSNFQANLISPYAIIGAVNRKGGTGTAAGGGSEFTLGNGYNLFAEYIHVTYNGVSVAPGEAVKTDNLVRLGVNRKF